MNNNKINILILTLFPFIFLFPMTLGILTVGNDFESLYFSYKKYIFDFFINDIFVYWSPAESNGYSLIYNPFAQFFYLPGWLNILFHKFFELDFTRYNYLIYTILGISIFNVGNYFWLRKLNFKKSTALTTCLIIIMGLKINEILRFPNAIHSFCWFSWMLYGLTLSKYNNQNLKSFLIIFFCWLFILTAGYPYYIFYGFILFFSYYFFISLKNFDKHFLNEKQISNLTFKNPFFKIFFPTFLSSLIALPWLLKVNEILEMTRDRGLKSINYTNNLNSDAIDHLGSWIMPKISIAEGWFYNGTLVTFLIIFFILSLFFVNNKNKFIIISFLIFYLIIFEISKAGDSFVFNFILNQFDQLKNFRVWSRINIIMLPALSLIVAASIDHFKNYLKEKEINKNYISLFIFSMIVIIIIQFNYIDYDGNIYWNEWQGRRINFVIEWFKNDFYLLSKFVNLYQGTIYFLFSVISFFFLISFILLKNKILKLEKFFLFLIIFLVFSELFFLANIQWALPGSAWDKKYINESNIIESLNNSFDKHSVEDKVYGNEYYKRNKTFMTNYIENFGYHNHSKIYDTYLGRYGKPLQNKTENEIEDFKFFYAIDIKKEVRRIFFTKSIKHTNIHTFLDDHKKIMNDGNFKLKVNRNFYSGNILDIDVFSSSDGYITFVDNYDPNWEASINDKNTKIIKFLDAYKSIKIKSGKSNIVFKYNPWQINFD